MAIEQETLIALIEALSKLNQGLVENDGLIEDLKLGEELTDFSRADLTNAKKILRSEIAKLYKGKVGRGKKISVLSAREKEEQTKEKYDEGKYSAGTTPINVGNCLSKLFSKRLDGTYPDYGKVDPSDPNSANLIDELKMVKSGYMLKTTYISLIWAYIKANNLNKTKYVHGGEEITPCTLDNVLYDSFLGNHKPIKVYKTADYVLDTNGNKVYKKETSTKKSRLFLIEKKLVMRSIAPDVSDKVDQEKSVFGVIYTGQPEDAEKLWKLKMELTEQLKTPGLTEEQRADLEERFEEVAGVNFYSWDELNKWFSTKLIMSTMAIDSLSINELTKLSTADITSDLYQEMYVRVPEAEAEKHYVAAKKKYLIKLANINKNKKTLYQELLLVKQNSSLRNAFLTK